MEAACYYEMLIPVYFNTRAVSQTTALFLNTVVRNTDLASLTFGLLCTGVAPVIFIVMYRYYNIVGAMRTILCK
jgi:hypothetical protein